MRVAEQASRRLPHGFTGHLPAPLLGAKGLFDEAVKGAIIEPLLNAIKAIWFRHLEDDALVRKTIETQLEATTWANFAVTRQGP